MKPVTLLSLFTTLSLWASSPHQFHGEAERNFHPAYASQATGALVKKVQKPNRERYPWPVKVLSIGHTIASYQNYDFEGARAPYFHHGLDIRADSGTDVLASAGGKVVNIENYILGSDYYWEVAILDKDGFIWQYHHVDKNSIPDAIYDAFKKQTPIGAGTKIGEVVAWDIETFGEVFHHIHLNILGKGKAYLNPFEFLEPLPDKSAPEISDFHLLQNGIISEKGSVTPGNYSIAVEVKDLILSDVFVVPPNDIKITIDGSEPLTVWKFDGLPGGASNTDFVNDFFPSKLACGDYECRRPVINLGFNKSGKMIFPKGLGRHSLELIVSDYNRNESRKAFDWVVK